MYSSNPFPARPLCSLSTLTATALA
jgi:hypothetical protein